MKRSAASPLAIIVTASLVILPSCSKSRTLLVAAETSSGQTLDFVFSNMAIDTNDSSPAAGFNIDGLYTVGGGDGCDFFGDRVSDVDPSENLEGCTSTCTGDAGSSCVSSCQGGVDNMLPQLVNVVDGALRPMTRQLLAASLAAGRIVYLLRLTGVDSLQDDAAIDVALFIGFANDGDCSTLFGGGGHFLVDNRSLLTIDTLSQPRWHASGSIVNGRFRAVYNSPTGVMVPTPGGTPINLLALRATLGAEGDTASFGNMGGFLSAASTDNLLTSLWPQNGGIYGGIIPQLSDLPATGGTCSQDYANFAGVISAGMRFDLIHAVIDGTASTHPPGTCGH